jgi:hypothetical protein
MHAARRQCAPSHAARQCAARLLPRSRVTSLSPYDNNCEQSAGDEWVLVEWVGRRV